MAKRSSAFSIDDKLGTLGNLGNYGRVLEAMDSQLGAALNPQLASLAAGQQVDAAAIWDALYAAMASVDPDAASPDGAGDE